MNNTWHKFDLDEMDQFIKRHNLTKFTSEELDDKNRPIYMKETEPIINDFLKHKVLGLSRFTCEFCKIFKKDIIPILYISF